MSYLRIQHVFMGLMGLGAVSAFVVPPKYSSLLRPPVQAVFAPVSRPAGSIAAWVNRRVAPPISSDVRSAQDVKQENAELRAELAWLGTQLDELRRRDNELSQLGSIKGLCRIVKVIGADAGSRESIFLAVSNLRLLRDDMYVLFPEGLVGRIQQAGAGSGAVQLITDPQFRIKVKFSKYVGGAGGRGEFQTLAIPIALAEGAGGGAMVIRGLTLSDLGINPAVAARGGAAGLTSEHGLAVGDYVQVADGDCPRALQGSVLGRVVSIGRRADARLFADIRVEPAKNLKKLREVMVMTKEQ